MLNQETNIQVVLYIANKLKEKGIELSETKLYKLLWFASLRMADNQGDLILEDVFIRKQFGPVPENVFNYVNDIKNSTEKNEYIKIDKEVKSGMFDSYKQYNIIPLQSYNEDFLTTSIKKGLDFSINTFGHVPANKLSKLSHGEAWEKAGSDDKVMDITQDMQNEKYKEIVKEEYANTIWILTKVKYAI